MHVFSDPSYVLVPVSASKITEIIPTHEEIIISAEFKAKEDTFKGAGPRASYQKFSTHGIITRNGFYYLHLTKPNYFDWQKISFFRGGLMIKNLGLSGIRFYLDKKGANSHNPKFQYLSGNLKKICKGLKEERINFWTKKFPNKKERKGEIKAYQNEVINGVYSGSAASHFPSVRCPDCGTNQPRNTEFCVKCGKKFRRITW